MNAASADFEHELKPSLIDARDGRPTAVPGPSPVELRAMVDEAKADPEFQFPGQNKQFLSSCTIEGLSSERMAAAGTYKSSIQGQEPARTRKIDNDYSQFEALDQSKKEIRLVFLKSGVPDDPIMPALVKVSYPWNQISWTGLSYCWGSLEETRNIMLIHRDGGWVPELHKLRSHIFTITANLEIALRGIRRSDRDLWLWVDALTINQGDQDERAYQVSIMSDIYGKATNVGVWLAIDPTEHDVALYVKAISNAFVERRELYSGKPKNEDSIEADVLGSLTIEIQSPSGETEVDQLVIPRALGKLFQNPWFRRVWVTQEIWSCGGSSVVVWAGKHDVAMSWPDMLRASRYLDMVNERQKLHLFGLPEVWHRIGATERRQGGSPTHFKILDMFEDMSMTFQSTDPRDMIISLLAMCEETHDIKKLPPTVAPNYTKTVARVYADFTRWSILHDNSLRVLSHVTYMNRSGVSMSEFGQWPSWALSHLRKFQSRGMLTSEISEFETSDNTSVDADLLCDAPDDLILRLRGYRLDVVSQVLGSGFQANFTEYFRVFLESPDDLIIVQEDSNGSRSYHTGGVTWLWRVITRDGELAKNCKSPSGGSKCACQQELDAMISLLTSGGRIQRFRGDDETSQSKIIWATPEDLYASFAAHWVARNRGRLDPDMEHLFCQNLREQLLPLAGQADSGLFARYMVSSNNKMYFQTANGHSGLCPPGTCPDDVIVALCGGKAPYVVRAHLDAEKGTRTWNFVGECFLPNYTTGDTVRRLVDEGYESEIFSLR